MSLAVDILLLLIGVLLILVGLAGCIVPVIPGPPLSFAGLLLLRFTRFVSPERIEAFDPWLWIAAFAAAVATVLDYIVPAWGARTFGATRHGTFGAMFGLLVGLPFAPLGIIVGPFLGAVAGELLAGRNRNASLRAGLGSLLGFLGGTALKLAVSGLITWLFVREVLTF